MQLEAVETFVAVCEHGSVQGAARHLHISQPAVSKRLGSLETRLGHKLFDRIGRGLELTEAGAAWLPHARELLAVMLDGRRTLDNLGDTVAGRLRMGLSHHVGLHRMPPVLRSFVRTYPRVEMDITFADSETACRSVARGDLEIAVITLPTPPHPVLQQYPVWDDPMGLFVAPEHPLAANKSPRLADLHSHPALLPPENSTTFALIKAVLTRHGIRVTPRMTSHYLETLRMLAGAGIGWTVLPLAMRDHELRQITFGLPPIHRRLGIVRDPRRSLSNAARVMVDLLTATGVVPAP